MSLIIGTGPLSSGRGGELNFTMPDSGGCERLNDVSRVAVTGSGRRSDRGGVIDLWAYPSDRYYYGWYGEPFAVLPSDAEIKATLVDRLRENPHTEPYDLRVDVKQRVVILGGHVGSTLAKRVAGGDAWDTRGVADVSNQIVVDAA